MVDLSELARNVAMAGGGLAAFTFALDRSISVLGRLGALPARWRRIDVARAERIHDESVKQEAINAIVEVWPALVRLGHQAEVIIAAISPNGGASMRDAITRIEGKLTDHIEASDRVEARVYSDLAEVGGEVDVLRRLVRELNNPPALPTEGT